MTIPDIVALFVAVVVLFGPGWIYEQTVYEIEREKLENFYRMLYEHLGS